MKYRVSCIIEDEKLIGPLAVVLATHGKVTVEAERSADEIIHSLHPPAKGKSAPAVTMHKAATETVRRARIKHPAGSASRLVLEYLTAGRNKSSQLKTAFKERKRSPNGVGPTLSKLKHKGFVRQIEGGAWELTEKGRAEADRQMKPRPTFADHEGQAEARADA